MMGYAMKDFLLMTGAAFLLAACGNEDQETTPVEPETPEQESVVEESPGSTGDMAADAQMADEAISLDAVLAAQSEEAKARYPYRNPKETLEFLGVEPGMTVVEVLPGGGWYSKILLPYLGGDGMLVGADYALGMWEDFGGNRASEEFLSTRETWPETWVADAQEWRGEESAALRAFAFGNVPEELKGTADTVLMVRAYHHFNRLEDEGQWRTKALEDVMALLKPGGVVGIVQHRAPEDNSDEWASGDNGYVKQSAVIAQLEAAGFELVEASEINANPKDTPTEEDVVWRLPPSLGTSRDNETLRAEMTEIGESDRMTLKFRKPAE